MQAWETVSLVIAHQCHLSCSRCLDRELGEHVWAVGFPHNCVSVLIQNRLNCGVTFLLPRALVDPLERPLCQGLRTGLRK